MIETLRSDKEVGAEREGNAALRLHLIHCAAVDGGIPRCARNDDVWRRDLRSVEGDASYRCKALGLSGN